MMTFPLFCDTPGISSLLNPENLVRVRTYMMLSMIRYDVI